MDLSSCILNFDYIDEFEIKENEYNILYKNPVTTININLHFVNFKKIINTISFEYVFTNSLITSENLLYLIKKHSNDNYFLDTIVIFNFNIDETDIKSFINKKISISNYFKIYKNIIDINIQDTITFFHELNSIDIYLKNKSQHNSNNNNTKKIYITNHNKHNKHNKHNNKTKRKTNTSTFNH